LKQSEARSKSKAKKILRKNPNIWANYLYRFIATLLNIHIHHLCPDLQRNAA